MPMHKEKTHTASAVTDQVDSALRAFPSCRGVHCCWLFGKNILRLIVGMLAQLLHLDQRVHS